MRTALTDLLAHQIAARHCPGALVHVEQAGRVLARHAAGQVRPEGATAMHFGLRFRIASLTKPVVTLAALMLADEGRLDLDAPVGELLPVLADLRLAGGARPARPPSVRDLMRHSSGLAYPFEIRDAALRATWLAAGFNAALSGLDGAAFLAALARLPLVAEPGTAFRYGYSTDVLGCIVERLDGLPLGQALQRRLFGPLGMAHTGFELAPGEADTLATAFAEDAGWHAGIPAIGQRQSGRPWMDSGGGGLLSTLDDYAAFARLLANGGQQADGRRLLSARGFAEMTRDQLPPGVDGPAGYTGPGFGFGLGLAVRHDWGPGAMPCQPGELTWSGISGTALFVHPGSQWFALLFSANMASRMMARMMFRRAAWRTMRPGARQAGPAAGPHPQRLQDPRYAIRTEPGAAVNPLDIQAVIWDFGGVISTSPFEAFGRYEQARGLPADFLRGVNARNPMHNAWARFERNDIDLAAFDTAFADESAALGHRVPGREVVALLGGQIRPAMVEALRRLRPRLKIGLITNNVAGPEADGFEPSGRRAVLDLFHQVIESSKVGLRKPDPAIYRMMCQALGVAPAQAVFLDDLGINLKPARELGMQTIKVGDPDLALQQLEALVGMDLRT